MRNEFPERIETERLVIRVAQPGDGPAFNEAVVESVQSLSPWLAWVTPVPSVQESEERCRRAYGKYLLNQDLMVFFFEREGGALIGGSGLHNPNWTLRQFEVGYWGRSTRSGKGLMTEGVRALSDYALESLGAVRVFLTTDDANERSWRLAERAGFELEGVLRNERLDLKDRLRHTRVYARVPARATARDA